MLKICLLYYSVLPITSYYHHDDRFWKHYLSVYVGIIYTVIVTNYCMASSLNYSDTTRSSNFTKWCVGLDWHTSFHPIISSKRQDIDELPTDRGTELVVLAELLPTLVIQAPALAVRLAEWRPPRLLRLVSQTVEIPAKTHQRHSLSFVSL